MRVHSPLGRLAYRALQLLGVMIIALALSFAPITAATGEVGSSDGPVNRRAKVPA